MQAIYRMHGHANSVRAQVSFAAPMVGASPDNIGAKRLAEGGVPTIGAGSAQSGLSHPSGGEKLESDPN
jgi:hypothetical protein